MNASVSLSAVRHISRKASLASSRIEPLERRRLFAGSWTTIEDYHPAASAAVYYDIAADASGNVYAVGERDPSGGPAHGIVREKPAGSDTWTTLLDYSSNVFPGSQCSFNAVAVSPAGDLYVSGGTEYSSWVVLERPAGQSGFSVVDQVPSGWNSDLAVDAVGNVFAIGYVPVQVTVKTTGNKTTTRTERRWTVRERAAGASSFSTVDQFVYSPNSTAENYPYEVTTVSSGPAAGIYVVGQGDTGAMTPEHWIVRKSTDGGATWNTIDDFQSDSATTSRAEGVTADAAGNIYVAGETSQRYVISTSRKGTTYGYTYQSVVRKSTNGGASWAGDAQFSIGTFSSEVVGFGMGTDAAGQVYVVSPSCDANGAEHSIVRSNAGGAWQTVDDYQLASGIDTGGFGFAAGPDGTLYAAGYAQDSAGIHGFVRSNTGSPVAAMQQSFSALARRGERPHRLLLDL